MPCQVFVYDALLNQLTTQSNVIIDALSTTGSVLQSISANSSTAGYGAVVTYAKGEFDLLVREGRNLLAPVDVEGVNGQKPSRIDLVLLPPPVAGLHAGVLVSGVPGVRRLARANVQNGLWSPIQARAISTLHQTTLHLLSYQAPDASVAQLLHVWSRQLESHGIAVAD